MRLESILSSGRTFTGVSGSSKKRTVESLAQLIAKDLPVIDDGELFTAFMAREKLGTTGLGAGVAIPHCRLSGCNSAYGTLARLDSPVDFDSIDDQDVDLIFALIVPEEATDEHLQILAQLAKLFSQESFLEQLRDPSIDSNQALYDTFVNFERTQA